MRIPKSKVLTGKRFGRLTVLGEGTRTAGGLFRWLCACDCGNQLSVMAGSLRSGATVSCGCRHAEITTAFGPALVRHGLARTPTYRSWQSMIQRCLNENHQSFECYGGRGISVCERWTTFDGFLSDMGIRPTGTTLDRVDNDRGYEPSNCRWATGHEQTVNRRTTKLSADDVAEARALFQRGESKASIARRLGVASSYVNRVVKGLAWRGVP